MEKSSMSSVYSYAAAVAPTTDPQPVKKKKARISRELLKLLGVMFLIGGFGGFGWLGWQSIEQQQELDRIKAGGADALQEIENAELVKKVARLIRLPSSEDPQIATVLDVESLVEQYPFFEGARNGDRLIIYPKSQKVILYSPQDDILVNVGPLIVDQSEDNEAQSNQSQVDSTLQDVAGVDTSANPTPPVQD